MKKELKSQIIESISAHLQQYPNFYLTNIEGSVAMANRGPGTNGSQFYINQINNNYLDGNYTVFGQVYEGMDVVNAIASVKTGANDKPLKDVILESAELHEYEG